MKSNSQKIIFVYTLYSSLGDFFIIGDLVYKIERLSVEVKCLCLHSNNPFVPLWKYPDRTDKFFNIFRLSEFVKFWTKIKKFHREGYTVIGLQQAPGSLRGFFFLKTLKLLGMIDYVVDFNLYNADIITKPNGNYILDIHLNQISEILKINIPTEFYHLQLPINISPRGTNPGKIKIGLHPWTRREQFPCFVWPENKWIETIKSFVDQNKHEIVLFGKNPKFDQLKKNVTKELKGNLSKSISFRPSHSIKELIETIDDCQMIISVSTAVVHIGYALDKKMLILAGPNLDFWMPKGKNIMIMHDKEARFPGGDKYQKDSRFPSTHRIEVKDVLSAFNKLLSD